MIIMYYLIDGNSLMGKADIAETSECSISGLDLSILKLLKH